MDQSLSSDDELFLFETFGKIMKQNLAVNDCMEMDCAADDDVPLSHFLFCAKEEEEDYSSIYEFPDSPELTSSNPFHQTCFPDEYPSSPPGNSSLNLNVLPPLDIDYPYTPSSPSLSPTSPTLSFPFPPHLIKAGSPEPQSPQNINTPPLQLEAAPKFEPPPTPPQPNLKGYYINCEGCPVHSKQHHPPTYHQQLPPNTQQSPPPIKHHRLSSQPCSHQPQPTICLLSVTSPLTHTPSSPLTHTPSTPLTHTPSSPLTHTPSSPLTHNQPLPTRTNNHVKTLPTTNNHRRPSTYLPPPSPPTTPNPTKPSISTLLSSRPPPTINYHHNQNPTKDHQRKLLPTNQLPQQPPPAQKVPLALPITPRRPSCADADLSHVHFIDVNNLYEKTQVRRGGVSEQRLVNCRVHMMAVFVNQLKSIHVFVHRFPEITGCENFIEIPITKEIMLSNSQYFSVNLDAVYLTAFGNKFYQLSTTDRLRKNRFQLKVVLLFADSSTAEFKSEPFLIRSRKQSPNPRKKRIMNI